MPTENRCSNTEMVSVPRDLLARISSTELEMSSKKDRHAAAFEVRAILARPAPQPYPEPIAWMVGTAFWWTKEEAERDAAATGLPIVGLGPMTGAGEAEQLREVIKHSDEQIMRQSLRISNQRTQLAERDALLRDIASGYWELTIELPADLLARLQALSASAEPSTTIWGCRPCHLEQPADRPRDVCDGKTELAGAKS